MSTRLFGTDGIRGVANRDLTPELAFAVGRAAATTIPTDPTDGKPFVIGRDTRLSGTMLEAAMIAGITSAGRDVVAIGVVPTPGVAFVTRSIEAAAGVMISASHNPIEDNGIKFFGPDGFKLTDADEDAIAAGVAAADGPRPTHMQVGIARTARGLIDGYAAAVLAHGADLRDWTVVVDAANGAAFAIGPAVFRRLGARVIAINAADDGAHINVACGATDLTGLRARVLAEAGVSKHLIGVAFDGDADRVKFVDRNGRELDGDHLLLALARDRHARGALPGSRVVSTVMSNIGFERALERDGITLERAAVGDRYVLEALRAGMGVLGGEQSGHIIDLDVGTTGDGVMTAVRVLAIAARADVAVDALSSGFESAPQVLLNVRVSNRSALCDPTVRAAVEMAERELGANGRVLVRASGTEPLVRVMVEGPQAARTLALAESIAATVRAAEEFAPVTGNGAAEVSSPPMD